MNRAKRKARQRRKLRKHRQKLLHSQGKQQRVGRAAASLVEPEPTTPHFPTPYDYILEKHS